MGFVLYSAYISHLLFLPASILQNTRLVVLAEWNLQKKSFCKFTLTPSHSSQTPSVYRGFKCEGKCEGVRVSVRVELQKNIYSTLL